MKASELRETFPRKHINAIYRILRHAAERGKYRTTISWLPDKEVLDQLKTDGYSVTNASAYGCTIDWSVDAGE